MSLKDRRFPGMASCLALLMSWHLSVCGQTKTHVVPDDPAIAWKQLLKLQWDLVVPEDGQKQKQTPEQTADHQKQVRQMAAGLTAAAREFLERFPSDENAKEARY